MNELINDKAVYRTAPATPGLLIMRREWYGGGEVIAVFYKEDEEGGKWL